MEFYTHWKRPTKKNYEKNSGEILVEKVGYISAQKRIENLMLAGERLVASRTEAFDFAEGKEPDLEFSDFTRSKNIDRVDIDEAQAYLEKKSKLMANDIKDKAKLKPVQKDDIDKELQSSDSNSEKK